MDNLKGRPRSELVEIAREIGIEGLFSMTCTEIAEQIVKERSSNSLDSSYISKAEKKLRELSREELVEIGRKAGVEKMFSMRRHEIVEAILKADDFYKAFEDAIEEKESKASRKNRSPNNTTGEGKIISKQSESPKSFKVDDYAERIRGKNSASEAMEVVNDYSSEISHLDLEEYDSRMKSLFDKLGTQTEVELAARKLIVSTCSTKRVSHGAEIAKWVYDMYKDLGYPIDRGENLGTVDMMTNLYQGERYLAQEIPYRG